MMQLGDLWSLQGQLLTLLVVGLLLRKIGLLTQEAKVVLTDFVLYVTLPCSIVLSFRMDLDSGVFAALSVVFFVSVGIQFFCYGLSKLVFKKQEEGRKRVLRYGLLVSNSGFLGLPIAGELFGSMGFMLASIYLIPQRIVMWSAGLTVFSSDSGNPRQLARKVLLHPCMVAVYLGLVIMITDPPIPRFLLATMDSIGSCTTALSMILIGTIFAEMDKDIVRMDRQLFIFSFYRLFLIPYVSYLVSRLLGIDPLITGVAVILAAMPGGSSTAILSAKYGGDTPYASKMVILSTLLSMLSIPLWGMVL